MSPGKPCLPALLKNLNPQPGAGGREPVGSASQQPAASSQQAEAGQAEEESVEGGGKKRRGRQMSVFERGMPYSQRDQTSSTFTSGERG
ncbi:hypothetical protein PBY51_012587 [Eleginops maclovinus]|uniref:Uncharacterized protein n=1 Tax=Eleginops maclovinus TaxID=56733 RepID=A0AAN8AWH4_ELEMC|nr:hypothetical protein PBY51_012587 [Eleginops maclovinus]